MKEPDGLHSSRSGGETQAFRRPERAAEAGAGLGVEFVEGGLEFGLAAFDFPFGAAQDGGGGGTPGNAFESAAQAVQRAVGQQPFLGAQAFDEGGQRRGTGLEVALDFVEAGIHVVAQGAGGVARPVAGEEEIAGDVDQDAAPAPPGRGEAGADGVQGGIGVGAGVDGAVQTHARGEIGIGDFRAEAPQEIGEEIAGGDAGGPAVGELQVGQQVHVATEPGLGGRRAGDIRQAVRMGRR